MINLIAGFFCSFFLHAFLFSFFFNINFNDYSEEKIIQLPVNLIFEEKIEPKPKKSSSENVKTTSTSFSEDTKSKNEIVVHKSFSYKEDPKLKKIIDYQKLDT